MKLSELNAWFVVWVAPKDGYPHGGRHRQKEMDGAQGVLFTCPLHTHGIVVWFTNPRGTPPAPAEVRPTYRWTIAGGTSLDDLSLTPSINCDLGRCNNKCKKKHGDWCETHWCLWHGTVAGGVITTC